MFQLSTTLSNILEYSSLFCGVISILLLLKEYPTAWIFGGTASLSMFLLFVSTKLYFQALLSLYYFIIGCYAYFTWKIQDPDKSLKISELRIYQHVIFIALGLILTIILYLTITFFDIEASIPLVDATIFAFSIITQYIQARKILSNFLYWVIIDLLATGTSIFVGLYYVALLNIFFTVCACAGYIMWKKSFKKNQEQKEMKTA